MARRNALRLAAHALATLALLPPASAKPGALERKVDAAVADYVSADSPGATVAVIQEGEVVLLKAYGLADLEEETPLRVESNFDLASCSKQFTASCIMLLADRGELSFDDDIREYFPELPVWNAKRAVTIDDLLRMSSGLPEYDTDDQSLAGRKEMVRWLKEQKLAYKTGSRFEYTNTNYALLGFIVTQVSGKPLSRFMHDELFVPLGMATTVFYGSEEQTIPNRVWGYAEDEDGEYSSSVWDAPGTGDGNVFSNVRELAAWAAAQEDGTLLEAETLGRQVTAAALDSGKPSGYGYGLHVDEYHGTPRYSHDGSWYGTSSWYARHPAKALTVIVLSNLEDTASWIGEAVADVVLDTARDKSSSARRRGGQRTRRR